MNEKKNEPTTNSFQSTTVYIISIFTYPKWLDHLKTWTIFFHFFLREFFFINFYVVVFLHFFSCVVPLFCVAEIGMHRHTENCKMYIDMFCRCYLLLLYFFSYAWHDDDDDDGVFFIFMLSHSHILNSWVDLLRATYFTVTV